MNEREFPQSLSQTFTLELDVLLKYYNSNISSRESSNSEQQKAKKRKAIFIEPVNSLLNENVKDLTGEKKAAKVTDFK